MFPETFVMRHGETEWNRAGRHQGRLDSPLTSKGKRQAVHLGEMLAAHDLPAGFQAVSSPIGRSKQTAELASAPLGCPITYDDRLVEVSFGEWEGKTKAEIEAGWPELYGDGQDMFSWHFKSPGGESFASMRDRVGDFLSELQHPTLIFTHGITSRMIRGLWLGLDADGMSDLPGGQGCIYHLKDGKHHKYD